MPDDFDNDDPTQVTPPELLESGAVELLMEEEADPATTPRCGRCGRIVKVAGDRIPDIRTLVRAMRKYAPFTCWRAMGGNWWWCGGKMPRVLRVEVPE